MSDQSNSSLQREPAERIVITGMGAVSPYGLGVERLVAGLHSGTPALGPISAFELNGCRASWGARVPDLDLTGFDGNGTFRRAPRASRFSMVAADEALHGAVAGGLPWSPERVGVFLGTYRGMTEVSELIWTKLIDGEPRFVPALLFQETVTNAVASAISIRWGLKGTDYAISAGNASGFQVLYLAVHELLSGRAEAVLAGAFDLFTRANHHDMDDLGMLSPTNTSRPFDRRRDGFLMGEGAVIVVLETLATARARGAEILAEIAGVGVGHDAHGFAANHPQGIGLAAAAGRALTAAGVDAAAIGYVGAAANSTQSLDRAEAAAMRQVFGAAAGVPVSSLKGATGEAMAASDLFNLVATVTALGDGRLPPQMGTEETDEDCALNLVPLGDGPRRVDHALIHSYSYFGGSAAAVVLQPGPERSDL